MLSSARFVHFVTLDVEPGWEPEFDRWYAEQELRRSTTDRLPAQRYRAVRGPAAQMLLYELESLEPFPVAQLGSAGSPSGERLGPHVTMLDAVYEQIFPSEGIFRGVEWGDGDTRVGGLRVTRVDARPEQDADVNAWYHDEHIPRLCRCTGAIGGRRFKAVEGAPMYMTIIYLTEPNALEDPAWQQASATPWSARLRDAFTTRWSASYRAF